MSYQLLFNELARYPGASDEEIAAALSVVTTVPKLAKVSEIIAWAFRIKLYPKLQLILLDDQYPAELKALAKSLTDLNTNIMPEIDPFEGASQEMLDNLQTASLITQEQREQVEALGIASRTSRAAQLGFPEGITTEDIEAARAWAENEAVISGLRDRLQSAYNQAMGRLGELPAPEWADIVAIFEAA